MAKVTRATTARRLRRVQSMRAYRETMQQVETHSVRRAIRNLDEITMQQLLWQLADHLVVSDGKVRVRGIHDHG